MQPGIKYQMVELVVPADSVKLQFTFDPQPFLGTKKIVSIETFTDGDVSLSPLGNVPPTGAQASGAYLTLYGMDPDGEGNALPVGQYGNQKPAVGNWLRNIPYLKMHTLQNSTPDPFEREGFELEARQIVWEQSTVSVGAALGNNSDLSFLFLVGYTGVENGG